jgi:outer membrane protein TolC
MEKACLYMKHLNSLMLNAISPIIIVALIFLFSGFGFAQVGEQIDIGDDGFNPLTDDITKKIPSLEVLIDSAIINSHRLKYWDKEISISEYELKTTKREWANTLAVTGNVSEGQWTSLSFLEDQFDNTVGTLGTTSQTRYSVGVSFRLPLMTVVDYNNQTKIAKMRIESKMEQMLQDKKAIRAEVINLYNELVIQQRMLQLDIDNLEYLSLATDMADIEYHQNKINLFDMSRFRDNLARARYRYVQTKINFINAYVMLQEVTGVRFSELNNWE